MKKKLSLLKLSKNDEKAIVGGRSCNFNCSTGGCSSCSSFYISYAYSDNYSYNRANDIYNRDTGN